MRITVTQIHHLMLNKTRVIFNSNIGSGIALWVGAIPNIGETYEVEIDIPYRLKWGIDIVPTDIRNYHMWQTNDSTKIVGQLISESEKEYFAVKVQNSVFLIEAEGIPFPINSFLEMNIYDMQIYDTDI